MKTSINKDEKVIAVDGKAIRSTSKTDNHHSALQIITAYLTESGVVLGQEKINEKTNEIPVLQQMLEYENMFCIPYNIQASSISYLQHIAYWITSKKVDKK